MNKTPMEQNEIAAKLAGLRQASEPGKVEDGTRVHVWYEAIGTPTATAIKAAERAAELGLPRDRYTGRVSRIWTSKVGDQMLTLFVELERDHLYRAFNLSRGKVYRIVKMGE